MIIMVPLNLRLGVEMIVDEHLAGKELLKNQNMNQDEANEMDDQVLNEARDEMVNHREATEVEVIIHETQNHIQGHHVTAILEIKEITKETQKRKENRLRPLAIIGVDREKRNQMIVHTIDHVIVDREKIANESSLASLNMVQICVRMVMTNFQNHLKEDEHMSHTIMNHRVNHLDMNHRDEIMKDHDTIQEER